MTCKCLVKYKHNYIQSYRFWKKTTEKSVAIPNQSLFVLDSWNDEIFVVKKPIMKINAVEFMYEELCYKILTSKYEKPNSNINNSNISNLPFDMLCSLLEYMMTLWKIYWQ